MLNKLRREEEGFTLIELLVVILIIGILAAIALPTFLGQQKKGQDSEAKSSARNLVSQVESCFADTQDYTSCQDANLTNTGLDLGSGTGQVTVASVTTATGATQATGYTITAKSKNQDHTFSITKSPTTGVSTRSCSAPGDGGCKAVAGSTSGTW